MKKFLLLLPLIFLFSLPAYPQLFGTSCKAIYQVPEGEPYNTRAVRPPFWTIWRWDCLETAQDVTAFETSPANGTDHDFQLALPFVTNPPNTTFYPILYVNDWLTVFKNGEPVGTNDAFVTQGTGIVHFINAPDLGDVITFDIMLDLEDEQ